MAGEGCVEGEILQRMGEGGLWRMRGRDSVHRREGCGAWQGRVIVLLEGNDACAEGRTGGWPWM